MGVKQLWTLLGPVGRPVLLETMEGKTMAIDSSIWIYQFQATMRDKDGRALVNAHVLGFLRRICKLLFYGIKPVFVFDGGAPALKRTTITERKKKKAGAADSHARVAEKLLAAHMRREAIAHVEAGKEQKSFDAPQPVLDEDTIYLEDLEANNVPKRTPTKNKGKGKQLDKTPDSAAAKKAKFHDHDPYRLPDVDPTSISQPTSSLAPDPRLATEDELRTFIDAMRPEDFDVSSPAFRDLPTEVQYEIIGDLRLKSRQTSYKRLQTMLRSAPTPLDFSKAQIRNLQQRNALTQQLLETTDSIGKANVTIPVRIASERNKEYVLVKNQGKDGGWVLGIRDEGTQAKPIVIEDADHKDVEPEEDEDSEMEMEEVAIPESVVPDPDLREYRGRMALASIAKRNAPKMPAPRPRKEHASTSKHGGQTNKTPLFLEEDVELDIAIKESMEQQEADALQQAITASKNEVTSDSRAQSETSSSTSVPPVDTNDSSSGLYEDLNDEDLYEAAPSRLDTALAFANTSPSKRSLSSLVNARSNASMFGTPALLLSEKQSSSAPPQIGGGIVADSEEDDDMEEVLSRSPKGALPIAPEMSNSSRSSQDPSMVESDDGMEEIIPIGSTQFSGRVGSPTPELGALRPPTRNLSPGIVQGSMGMIGNPQSPRPSFEQPSVPLPERSRGRANVGGYECDPTPSEHPLSAPAASIPLRATSTKPTIEDVLDEEEFLSDWDRSSSPIPGPPIEPSENTRPSRPEVEDWDAAQEMDVTAEEGDFAHFVSQVKGQDLEDARRDIDDEIRVLNKQKKAAMRDSEDITQQMISQIMLMLRLFGIPYITAPMEAEAQCAALVSLGLVEGIITDDSDVFLFGGMRVFKNMFNQSKTVECFLLSDLARELGLERDKLVRLAYLLGSDYVDGLPGVGPVVAMELMKEFPGEDGLHKFKEWWQKVQSGKDSVADTKSKFRRRFKKRYKDLYLPVEWPNPAVRDAYYHPAVDQSEEPFKWGLPDLDALRDFFREELSWPQAKVDDLLLPIIQQMGKRGQAAAANRQGTLDGYFDVSLGSGTYAPRKRQAYSSKRLQQVVADFRAEQNKIKNGGSAASKDGDYSSNDEESPPKKKRKGENENAKGGPKKAPTKGKAGGGKAQRGTGRKRKAPVPSRPESEEEEVLMEEGGDIPPPPALSAKLRPRPRPVFESTAEGQDEEEVEGQKDDSDDEFVIKRPRRKL